MFNDSEIVGLVKAVARLSLALQQMEDQSNQLFARTQELEAEVAQLKGATPDQPTLTSVE